jgi:hypothetical protein
MTDIKHTADTINKTPFKLGFLDRKFRKLRIGWGILKKLSDSNIKSLH